MKAPKGRKITRQNAANIFYNETKLKKFYGGIAPNSLSLQEVHSRLELYTTSGRKRKIQGIRWE